MERESYKISYKIKRLSYTNRLKVLKLPTLTFRQPREDLTEVYKILHGVYDSNCSIQFKMFSPDYATRSNSLKIVNSAYHSLWSTNIFLQLQNCEYLE